MKSSLGATLRAVEHIVSRRGSYFLCADIHLSSASKLQNPSSLPNVVDTIEGWLP